MICRIFETSSFGVRHAKMTHVNPFEWIQSAAFDRDHWSNLHFVPSTADCRFGWIFFIILNFQQKKGQSAVLSMAHAMPLSKRLRLEVHRKAQLVALKKMPKPPALRSRSQSAAQHAAALKKRPIAQPRGKRIPNRGNWRVGIQKRLSI